jgi:hypothetical protein
MAAGRDASERTGNDHREARMRMSSLGRTVFGSLVAWIPLAALAVLVSGMVYLTEQQSYRSTANDPQLQMATDAVNALNTGADPQSVVPATKLDIASSLAPYLAIYDANAQLVAASATQHGQPLDVPSGVFQSATANSPNVVTWQAKTGERNAIVVMPYTTGYVLAGRSLRPTEAREDQLLWQVAAACLVTLGGTYLAVLATRLAAAWLRLEPSA